MATATDHAPARPDWRDTLALAADLALLGIVLTVAVLPVLTAGAAVGTASVALHRWRTDGHWPSLGELGRRFLRELLPGVPVTGLVLAVGTLLALNLTALTAGTVPGGLPLTLLTGAVAVLAAGFAGLVVVEFGRGAEPDGRPALPGRIGTGPDGRVARARWRAASRRARREAAQRPVVVLRTGAVLVIAALVAVLVTPLVVPILAGYALAALHAVAYRGGAGRAASPASGQRNGGAVDVRI